MYDNILAKPVMIQCFSFHVLLSYLCATWCNQSTAVRRV